jgi:hypothetical protein
MSLATWRDARQWTFGNWRAAFGELAQGFNGEGYARKAIWYAHTGEQFRNERDANDIDGARGYAGWFTDAYGDEKAIGIVGMLTHGRYVAGYRWTSNDERVYFDEVFSDEVDAAKYADQCAESFAEKERDYSEQWQAARALEDATEDALTRLRECIALRHVQCMQYVRDEARGLVETIRANREKLRTDYKDYA